MCCHPALDPQARIALTLRCVCGLPTAEIAAAFLVPEATMAQRLVRAQRKIRQAGVAFRVPRGEELTRRLGPVLRVVYLVFTQGHRAAGGAELIRGELCDQAIRLARALAALLPGEPEAAGLLALLLLTDARRAAWLDGAGELVPLAEQDRGRWDRDLIGEGEALLTRALAAGRPGPYQLHAAIAACHAGAPAWEATDWPQILALYDLLLRHDRTPVTRLNRGIALGQVRGAAAALEYVDRLADDLDGYHLFHATRADLLRALGRPAEARAADERALMLTRNTAEQRLLATRLDSLAAGSALEP
jgi:RNA polymerase sigma-70 factor (ECF subfamily)